MATVGQGTALPEVKPFGELTELGQARRLRPLAEAALTEKNRENIRERNTVSLLIDQGALPVGTILRFAPGSDISAANREVIDDWIGSDDLRIATWRNSSSAPLEWKHDGKAHSPTGLVRHIASLAGVKLREVAGPRAWQDERGRTLPEIARDAAD